MDPVLQSLQVQILMAHRSTLGPNWQCEHTRDAHGRLYWIEAGEAWIEHHAERTIMQPGHLYLIPAQSDLAYGCEHGFEVWWVHFRTRVLAGLDLFLYLRCPYEVRPREPARVRALVRRLIRAHGSGDPGETLASDGCLRQLLALFVRRASALHRTVHQQDLLRLQPVLAHIQTHLADPLPLAQLAALLHLEPTYFSRIFSRALGQGPKRYILQRRIEQAQQLLLQTHLTLEAIAHGLGFVDAFHLSKTFKRLVGCPPQQFLAQRAARRP